MSKMGMELDKRLDENKYEMWEALRAIIDERALTKTDPLRQQVVQVLANIEGKDE